MSSIFSPSRIDSSTAAPRPANGDVDWVRVGEAQARRLLALAVGVGLKFGVAEQIIAGRAANGDPCAVRDVEIPRGLKRLFVIGLVSLDDFSVWMKPMRELAS